MLYDNEEELMKYLPGDIQMKIGWPDGMSRLMAEVKRDFPNKYEEALVMKEGLETAQEAKNKALERRLDGIAFYKKEIITKARRKKT